MEFTANFTAFLVQLSGIPIYRDGLFFTLPSGNWSVVEECSGVRYLIASFTMGCIYAYINYSSIRKRIIFISLSLIVPIIGNGLRAYGIVMIGHYSDMELAVGADHLVYGWLFFAVIIITLFYAGSFWRDPKESFAHECIASKQTVISGSAKHSFLILLICFVLIACFYSFSNYIKESKEDIEKSLSFSLPEKFVGWQLDNNRLLQWQPIFFNPDTEVSAGYSSGENFVQLNIGYFQAQRQGAEAVSTMNRIATPLGGEWKKVTSGETSVNGMKYTETEISNSDSKVLVWHWYRIGEYHTTSPYVAKALDAYNLIVEGRTDASMITVATTVDEDLKVSRQHITDFIDDAYDEIEHRLEQLQSP
jgi:EpsI family protein